MKRVLILANFDVGLYKFRKELIQELLNRGCEVFISVPDGEFVPQLVQMGCRFIDTAVDRRGINPATDLKLFLQYRKMLTKIRPDLVITYTIKPNIYGGLACRFAKIPYAVNITGLGTAFQKENLLKKMIVQMYKSACRRAKVVFFENEQNQMSFVKNKIVPLEKTHRLNGAGVNLEEYPFCEYASDNDEIRFLFIGRVMKEKGVDELFEAARFIRKENSRITFDVVGPFEENYGQIIRDLEAEHVIRYHGFQSDIKTFVENCHCFVLPSYHEGMANTLLECAAMGRPLITSNISGCKEAVIDGETGYLCQTHNSVDLCEKMKQFAELNEQDKRKMGERSRRHIEEIFDKKQVVKQTMRVMEFE